MDRDPASFRDPSGFIFHRQGVVYRAVSPVYAPHLELLHTSGLYQDLIGDGLLLPHHETGEVTPPGGALKVLRPEQLPFISYPYEWCPGQLEAAARLTLDVQQRALRFGMVLKDASAFNIQFRGTRPVLIDTLSFERYVEGTPWVAYHQFCSHFLAPLAVAAYRDPRWTGALGRFLDGLPLDMASKALPRRTWVKPALLFHLHLHARASGPRSRGEPPPRPRGVSRTGLEALVGHLDRAIRGLRRAPNRTEWRDYRETHGYQDQALLAKRRIVSEVLEQVRPGMTWDLGANTGAFSALAAAAGSLVIALDHDLGAVSRHYRDLGPGGSDRILPLWADLANPTPAVGWGSGERRSLLDRGPADLVLALALVHHLRVTHHASFARQAALMARMGRAALVEWVGPEDPQVRRLTAHRTTEFHDLERGAFEAAFGAHFRLVRQVPVADSGRILYLYAAP